VCRSGDQLVFGQDEGNLVSIHIRVGNCVEQ